MLAKKMKNILTEYVYSEKELYRWLIVTSKLIRNHRDEQANVLAVFARSLNLFSKLFSHLCNII